MRVIPKQDFTPIWDNSSSYFESVGSNHDIGLSYLRLLTEFNQNISSLSNALSAIKNSFFVELKNF